MTTQQRGTAEPVPEHGQTSPARTERPEPDSRTHERPVDRLLKISQVAARLGCSVSSVRRGSAAGIYPRPIRLPVREGSRAQAHRFLESEVEAFVDRLKADRYSGGDQ